MSGSSYRSFVRILERWPVDKNKQGKDIGEGLRQLFSNNFPSGSASKVNEKMINKQVAALESLIENKPSTSHPSTSKSTFTGLDQETLRQITSTEMMGQVSKESGRKITFMEKIKNFTIK